MVIRVRALPLLAFLSVLMATFIVPAAGTQARSGPAARPGGASGVIYRIVTNRTAPPHKAIISSPAIRRVSAPRDVPAPPAGPPPYTTCGWVRDCGFSTFLWQRPGPNWWRGDGDSSQIVAMGGGIAISSTWIQQYYTTFPGYTYQPTDTLGVSVWARLLTPDCIGQSTARLDFANRGGTDDVPLTTTNWFYMRYPSQAHTDPGADLELVVMGVHCQVLFVQPTVWIADANGHIIMPPGSPEINSPSLLPTTCNCAQPVNVATGAFWHTFHDVAVPGRGLPLHLDRSYDSGNAAQDSPLGSLGYGWTDNYNMYLTADTYGNVDVHEEGGTVVSFNCAGSTVCQGPSHVLASLVSSTDGSVYTYTRKDQEHFVFSAPTPTTATLPTTSTVGRLTSEVDRNGYATTLSYDPTTGYLSRVTDPAGRSLTFSYTGTHLTGLSDPIGRTVAYTYDASGNLSAVTDVGGGVTRFTYDDAHNLLTMTDPRGGTTTNVYSPAGQVIAQSDPLSRTTTFTYTANSDGSETTTITDARGLVTTEQYQNNELITRTVGYGTPQAATWSYSYDPTTLGVTSVTDPNEHTSTNTWDATGNLLSHTDALSRTTSYHYDSLNDTTAITDPLSVTTVMTYDANGNLLATARPLTQTGQTATTTLSYDPAQPGDVLTRTDPNGHTWHYSYDQYGDLASATDPLSRTTTYAYDCIGRRLSMVRPLGTIAGANPISYTTSYTYDAFGDTIAITDALGHVTVSQYDPDQNLITVTDALTHTTVYGYDLDNERTSVTRADGGVFRTGYDGDGNVISSTDALTQTTLTAYDALNRRISVTDPLSRTTLIAYDAAGNVISSTDPLSHTTLYGYDLADERTSVTHPDGGVLRLGYDLDGRVISSTDGLTRTTSYDYDSLNRLIGVTDPLNRTTGYGYDLAGNQVSVTDPLTHTTLYGYDLANERTTVTQADSSVLRTAYDADGNVISSTDPLTHTTLYSYDVLDRLRGTTDPLTHTTLYSYDAVGNQVSVTDPLSHTTLYQYDALNRVITVTDPLTHSTGYAYDLNGNQVSVTDARGDTTRTGFDADNEPVTTTLANDKVQLTAYGGAGNVISQTDALSRTTLYGYDLDNRLASVTDPLSRTTLYRYDLADEVISRTDALTQTTLYGYDLAGELSALTYALTTTPNVTFSYTLDGQRATMTDGTGTTSYQYDQLNRPITVTNGASQTVGYRYDLAGNLTRVIYPDSSAITRTYDAANRLSGITDWLGHSTAFSYDAANRLVTQVYPTSPTAITATSYYNAADQLTGLIDAAQGTAFWVFGYGRDADGRVSSALDPLTGYHTYGSDTLNRLGSDQATAPYTGTSGWSYDAANEPVTLSYSATYLLTDTLGYDPASELHSLQVQVNGALTHSYVYSSTATGDRAAVGDLLSPAMASYGWDQADRLITATNGITASNYTYNGDGLRMSKTVSGTAEGYVWDTAEGLPQLLQDGGTRYIMGPDGLPLESVSATGSVLYYLHDQLGSTRGLIDGSGVGVAGYSYTPYGTVSLHTGAVSTPFQFAGQYTDAETGFQYLQARYYDPATAQFLSVDPLAAQTRQPYVYAADDPLNMIDPWGLDDCHGFDPGCWGRNALQFGGDVAQGAGQHLGELAGGIPQTIQTVYDSVPPGLASWGPVGTAEDWQRFGSQWQHNIATASYLDTHPQQVVDAIVAPYREAIACGHPGAAVGRGAIDLAMFLTPGVDEAGAEVDVSDAIASASDGAMTQARQLPLPFEDLPPITPRPEYQWHHPYPKYLGGAEDQPLVRLPRGYHASIHRMLDRTFPRQAGTAAYTNVNPADVWRALSKVYNRYPLDIDPNTGQPFLWR